MKQIVRSLEAKLDIDKTMGIFPKTYRLTPFHKSKKPYHTHLYRLGFGRLTSLGLVFPSILAIINKSVNGLVVMHVKALKYLFNVDMLG